MSARDPFGGDPEDLGVRARRGLLGRSEQRELSRATEASATLRIAYEVGRDMDLATAMRGGDDALIAGAANAVLARVGGDAAPAVPSARRTRGGRRWLGAAAVALGVLSASGMAAALWTGMIDWPLRLAASEPAAPAAPQRSARKHAASRLRRVLSQLESGQRVPSAEATPAQPAQDMTAAPEPEATARARRSSAAELFHAASAARRSGDFTRAARLYAELRAAYPDSAEGELSRVSLGQLLLARGDAAGAEREFRQYLARARGQLTEEALVGQAQSLQRLGRSRAERESLQRLLDDYPGSVYAAQARARLAALDDAAASPTH